ncbi:AsmA2 domain-containing protein YhdP [Candidatus Steffania adelgidicola]|uniref:AsmA2 domain-containing protein YhdP n=1 Tax=Candidatus Steffania adelgidicola TaxID=1076626 RepID=UPI001D02C042|nr:AsmA2 domain-containing protein YhdP [Candidatus Steffania adelgidicola]UDG79727.1 hypothetical protein GFK82_00256 [Candidatus Steffania adelgidicola]
MKQLPKFLIAIGVNLIILVALTVTGLNLAITHLNHFRPQIVAILNHDFHTNIQINRLQASWESFGITLDIRGLEAVNSTELLNVEHLTLALDIWKSLLQWRWKFRDATFYNLQVIVNPTMLQQDQHNAFVKAYHFFDFFLRQFDQIMLICSKITVLTPSGEENRLSLLHVTWFNTLNHHFAKGKIRLSSRQIEQGEIEIQIDLYDQKEVLDHGKISLQAKHFNCKPWFNKLLKQNINLKSADFGLTSWVTITNGKIASADALLNKGSMLWEEDVQKHWIDIHQIRLHLRKQENTWKIDIPTIDLTTDGQAWAPATLSFYWCPSQGYLVSQDPKGEIRLRASGLVFERLTPLLSLISCVTPTLCARWHDLQPHGELSTLILDIPLSNVVATHFQGRWHDLSWQSWKMLPGMDHISGSVEGSIDTGELQLTIEHSKIPYQVMFRKPINLFYACATFYWHHNLKKELILWGRNIHAQAPSISVNGDFCFHQPVKGEPWLDVLAGLRSNNASNTLRYFPTRLMGIRLMEYLTSAVKHGKVDNGIMLFSGNPTRFSFKHKDGHLQVWLPLRHAEYQFQSNWPALKRLEIDLNFVNDGLFMYAKHTMFGEAKGRNVTASIPNYSKKKLLIDANISGTGDAVRNYFLQTPLKSSLGKTLNELRVSGKLHGNLHLDIPLSGPAVTASGDITLENNSLYLKSLDITLQHLNGTFHYTNRNIDSTFLDGTCFGQPIVLNFITREKFGSFNVNVGLKGDWILRKLPLIPDRLTKVVKGHIPWESNIKVVLPVKGKMHYEVIVRSDLKNIKSQFPAPFDKEENQPLTLVINAKGNMYSFTFSAYTNNLNAFNSQWLLLPGKKVQLAFGAWTDNGKIPPLPADTAALTLSIKTLDGDKWLHLLQSLPPSRGTVSDIPFFFPETLKIRISDLTLGGQTWHHLDLTDHNMSQGNKVIIQGQEIHGILTITKNAHWRADLDYLYYHPGFSIVTANPSSSLSKKQRSGYSDIFANWPTTFKVTCRQCWIQGQNLGWVSANIKVKQNQLTLTGGVIDNGRTRLIVEGNWLNNHQENKTSLRGRVEGENIAAIADSIGIDTPLRESPFNINYNLQWHGAPWQVDLTLLNGVLYGRCGKGKIENITSSSAGRILRLLSLDALFRKFQFDFNDAFGKGFYFDSIIGNASLHKGILHTNNLLIDGLEADIAMMGNLDFTQHLVDIEALIAPKISITLGMATACVINPAMGAAAFAASRVLAPLWNKLSLISYHISGNWAKPKIEEVLRQPRIPKQRLK